MTAQSKIEASLHSAMATAFAQIEGATKSANNPHFKTKYADLGAVIDAIKPALIGNGLFFTQRCQPSSGGVTVETVLHHSGGESMALGSLFVPANKQDAQGFGSALTYARRYALVTAFGVPTEDDDGNAAAASQRHAMPAKVEMMGAHQLAEITKLLPAAGKTEEEIAGAFKRTQLVELTADEADKALKRLRELAKAPAQAKEPVNA